ncbi:MAG: hypothetical protein AAF909_00925, partial [Pseudomonadota bacterium]
ASGPMAAAPVVLSAPDGAAAEEAAALRRRIAGLEGEVRRLRTERPASAPIRPSDDSASLKYRLWVAQSELRRLRDAPQSAAIAGPRQITVAPAAAATADLGEARRLRRLLSKAERGLRDLRASAATAAPSDSAEVATLRSELYLAQRAAADRAAEGARLSELEAEAARLREAAQLQPALSAEVDALRDRLRRAEETVRAAPSAETLRRREDEAAALRDRLSRSEREAERLKQALAAEARESRLAGAGASIASFRSATAPAPRELQDGRRAAAEPLAPDDESHAAARAALAAAMVSPLRGVEDAARELIESGRVVAVGSNRPKGLQAEPRNGPPDDLTLIDGVSPRLEAQMNRSGVHYFRQIAQFSAFDLAWLDDRLGLRGEVVRRRWAPQAESLDQLRREGRLTLGPGGKLSRLNLDGGARSGAAPVSYAAPEETIESLPAHPDAVTVTAPLTGAEAAALDLYDGAGVAPVDARDAPASFSREPFAADDDLDDLTVIRGVGPKLEAALRTLGVARYRQLAMLSPEEAVWLDRRLGLGGRVVRDRWLPQAALLADRAEQARREAAETLGAPPTGAFDRASLGAAELGSAAYGTGATAPAFEGAAYQGTGSTAPAFGAREAGGERPVSARPAPVDEGDDLKAIAGVNSKVEAQLNALGFHSFDQLAAFSAGDLQWLDATLSLKGRAEREAWVAQAARLAERKREGELRLGPDGTWTPPDPLADRSAAVAAALRAPLTEVEREAMRIIDGGRGGYAPRPAILLDGADGASPDPLQEIQGVNATLAQLLNDMGVFYFRQLAAFSAEDLAWLDTKLSFRGRVVRDRWAAQAAALDAAQRG